MNKALKKAIAQSVADLLRDCTRAADGEYHSDDVDNIAVEVSREYHVSEDQVRYIANLPR